MPKFVKAENGPYDSVIFFDENNVRYISRFGTRNLRNNNPGNLVPGAVSKRNGQIGMAGRFAVFPDIATGRRALADSLRNVHGERNLEEMIKRYAPSHENNTLEYLNILRKKTEIEHDKKIKDLTDEKMELLMNTIINMEGPKSPTITIVRIQKKQILRVRKDKKGTITDYDVEDLGWMRKAEAVSFARAGEIDAVLAMKTGRPYLRTRPDITVVNNLDQKE